MDRRDGMAISGSASFYMQQRGMGAGSGTGAGAQPGLNLVVSSGINPLANTSMAFQSSIGGSSNIGSTIPTEPSISAHNVNVGAPTAVPPSSSGEPLKRKRGRPRKYGPEGTVSLALSSPSLSTHSGTLSPTNKRKRGRPPGTGRKQQIVSFAGLLSGSAGIGFTPHVIHVEVGEDIATKLMLFSQQGPRAICLLSANGAVSTVTLCQPSSSGGTITYEGRFEILCLSGSYLPANDDAHNRSGILSVSLASPDGRVIGGGVEGMLVAASPVRVIVGSFLWGSTKSKNKKPEGPSDSRDSEHQRTGNPVTPTSILPSQNLTPTSSVGLRPSLRPVEMPDTDVDIDLMRG